MISAFVGWASPVMAQSDPSSRVVFSLDSAGAPKADSTPTQTSATAVSNGYLPFGTPVDIGSGTCLLNSSICSSFSLTEITSAAAEVRYSNGYRDFTTSFPYSFSFYGRVSDYANIYSYVDTTGLAFTILDESVPGTSSSSTALTVLTSAFGGRVGANSIYNNANCSTLTRSDASGASTFSCNLAPGRTATSVALPTNDLFVDGLYNFSGAGGVKAQLATFTALASRPEISPNGSVPEPASWALMLGGFGLLGVAMRRRTTRLGFDQR